MIKITALIMTIITLLTQLFTVNQKNEKTCDGEGTAVTQPIAGSGQDPFFTCHDGYYYYCYSIDTGLMIKKSEKLSTLAEAEGHLVYTAPSGTMYSYQYWAPELHYLNGEWYIYVAADNGDNATHRMYVLKGTSQDPTEPFEMVGKITDSSDKWAIDGTVLEYDGELYFVWSGWLGDTDGRQDLFIAHMKDPVTIDSERTLISKAELSWETKGMPINEGPAVLKKGDAVYIIYSASGSWTDDYCLGMLRLTGKDLLSASSWSKCLVPVFKQNKDAVYGPGHCSFIKSADGETDYIVYHGNTVSGSGWGGRQVRIQKFTWCNNIPVFGKPTKDGSLIYINE